MYGCDDTKDTDAVHRTHALEIRSQGPCLVALIAGQVVAKQPDAGPRVPLRIGDGRGFVEHRPRDPVRRGGHQLHEPNGPGRGDGFRLPAGLLPRDGEHEPSGNVELLRGGQQQVPRSGAC